MTLIIRLESSLFRRQRKFSTVSVRQTLETVLHHISKHLQELRQKHPAARRFFNSLLGVCICGQTRSHVAGEKNWGC